jgi:hypothetical protein
MRRKTMKTQRIFSVLAVLLLLFVNMFFAHPAYADYSRHYSADLESNWTWYAADNVCGLDLQVHDYGQEQWRMWFDDNGQLVRLSDHLGNLKRDVSYNGRTVTLKYGSGHYTYEFYPDTNTIVVHDKDTGPWEAINLPGYGRIWGITGQTNYTFTYDSNWNLINSTIDTQVGNIIVDYGPICDYMRR